MIRDEEVKRKVPGAHNAGIPRRQASLIRYHVVPSQYWAKRFPRNRREEQHKSHGRPFYQSGTDVERNPVRMLVVVRHNYCPALLVLGIELTVEQTLA